jgi:hypothetical protein
VHRVVFNDAMLKNTLVACFKTLAKRVFEWSVVSGFTAVFGFKGLCFAGGFNMNILNV